MSLRSGFEETAPIAPPEFSGKPSDARFHHNVFVFPGDDVSCDPSEGYFAPAEVVVSVDRDSLRGEELNDTAGVRSSPVRGQGA
jgi:hypothetical protein